MRKEMTKSSSRKKVSQKDAFNKNAIATLIIILIVGATIVLLTGNKNSFSRSFSSPAVLAGEEFVVKYSIRVEDDVRYFFLEDQVPVGFEIIDCNHDNTNKLKFYSIRLNKEDPPIGKKVYSCNIKAPSNPGEYTFVSEYFYEGISDSVKSSDIIEVTSG